VNGFERLAMTEGWLAGEVILPAWLLPSRPLRAGCAGGCWRSQPGPQLRALTWALLVSQACEAEEPRKGGNCMALQVAALSIQLIETLRPLVPRIKQRDKSLADQLTRAASSAALNIGEAELSDPGNRRSRFYTAAGSANETLTALRVAVAWGYLPEAQAQASIALLRRIIAILWRLTRA
jgi:four helix bundle protein